MLPTQLEDHRQSDDPTLLSALRDRDPLALAEAYHRTVTAANACARRFLASPARTEGLLRAVYQELWEDPPSDVALEGWVRGRCFVLAAEDLHRRGAPAASPSAASLLPDLPAPDVRYLDAAERALRELDGFDRTVLLHAHDCGIGAAAQGEGAAEALDRSLRALAGPETSSADARALLDDPCADVQGMGDWVLGLTGTASAAAFQALIGSRPGCAALARSLKRGRRRLEGLPPTPDMGYRILVSVLLSDTVAVATTPTAPPRASDEPETREQAEPPTDPEPPPTPADQAEIDTGELLMHEPVTPRRRAESHDADGALTSTDWAYSHAMSSSATTAVATRETERPRVTQVPDDLAKDRGTRQRDDRAEQTTESASASKDAPEQRDDFESLFSGLYSDEELISRPSTGQRVLVAIGYVLPIALGAVLGLYIADMLFSISR